MHIHNIYLHIKRMLQYLCTCLKAQMGKGEGNWNGTWTQRVNTLNV